MDASPLGARFGDDDLALFKPILERLVVVDLSGTAVTDRSAGLLNGMMHVRVLRLVKTGITDATILGLDQFDRLESLDLYGTAVTPASLKVAEHLPKLRRLYAGETKIPPDTLAPDALKGKLSF